MMMKRFLFILAITMATVGSLQAAQINEAVARQVADRVIFVDDGKILEQGAPEEIFSHPKEQRTKDFFSKIL